ncbi:phage Gp37/Gp68 family protein [Uliginosibacterium sediminicola]|uniref:Phage Gp37/Gp68 family protein n=1 Tax=Uliginosibacterium sediminicola TaxID=2024550 RepID=A0ABU9YWA2_9RHOO
MADKSNINWCDSTFNGVIGCTKVSPACDNCYAEKERASTALKVQWGAGKSRHRTSTDNWKKPIRWNKKPFCECEACGWRGEADWLGPCKSCGDLTLKQARRRVFGYSLGDWLDNEIPIEWFVDQLDLIRRTPNLDWLLLTKRIGNWRSRLVAAKNYVSDKLGAEDPESDALFDFIDLWLSGTSPAHVWLGASVCKQTEVDRDITKLLSVPASIHFLSIEPMLEAVDLNMSYGGLVEDDDGAPYPGHVDWVICGGESGPQARPISPDWARSLRDQCAAAGVPFLYKQWGEWIPMLGQVPSVPVRDKTTTPDGWVVGRAGAKAAGRLLDGRKHNEFPTGASQ